MTEARVGVEEDGPEARALARAKTLFESGDYAALRKETEALLRSENADVRRAAQDLLGKVTVDPFAVWVGVGTGLLLLGITYWYVIRP